MFHGFPHRTRLILDNIEIDKSHTIAEIGVGTGYSTGILARYANKIYGFDISKDTINLLKNRSANSITYIEFDMCKNVDKKYKNLFDAIVSMDTLEHVVDAKKVLLNVSTMLKTNGTLLVSFPNDDKYSTHGQTFFNTKDEFLSIIPVTMKIEKLVEVVYSRWLAFIYHCLFKPVYLLGKKLYKGNEPQEFQDTIAFKVNSKFPFVASLLNLYSSILMGLLSLKKKPYLYKGILEQDITNRRLLLILRKR